MWQSVIAIAKKETGQPWCLVQALEHLIQNQLQILLRMEYLLFYESQPIKFLSTDFSRANKNYWGQFGFIPNSLASNWAVVWIIDSTFGAKIFEFLIFEWFLIYHILKMPSWGLSFILIKHCGKMTELNPFVLPKIYARGPPKVKHFYAISGNRGVRDGH